MSRSAKDTNAAIFDRLSRAAAEHAPSIPAGERRVFLSEADYNVLVHSRRVDHFPIGRHQAAALLETPSGDVLAVAGFEADQIQLSPYVRELDVSPGLAVAAIADLEVQPTANAPVILDVVAVAKAGDQGYVGHDVERVLSLFPRVRCFEIDAEVGGGGNFHANLLAICASEAADGNGWIDEPLALELIKLAEQRIAGLPYEFLVMASLELDPKTLFLALYRCLEATYAFARASQLAARLGVTEKTWIEVAEALGESLSWYPRHDQSLAGVLALPAVSRQDLDALALSLGKDAHGDDLAPRVAAGIRELRNSLVHYGPTTRSATVSQDDWNRLCTPLAKVVGCVFAHTYGGVASSAATATSAIVGSEVAAALPRSQQP